MIFDCITLSVGWSVEMGFLSENLSDVVMQKCCDILGRSTKVTLPVNEKSGSC